MYGNMMYKLPHKSRCNCCRRLRALFGKDVLHNAVHGPSNRISAENQIKLIFGDVEFDEEGLTAALHLVNLRCQWHLLSVP